MLVDHCAILAVVPRDLEKVFPQTGCFQSSLAVCELRSREPPCGR